MDGKGIHRVGSELSGSDDVDAKGSEAYLSRVIAADEDVERVLQTTRRISREGLSSHPSVDSTALGKDREVVSAMIFPFSAPLIFEESA